jgi:hypothetical protein
LFVHEYRANTNCVSRPAKPFYRTFDEPDEARRVGERALVALDRGEMPEWLVRPEPTAGVTVAQVILKYRNIRAVPASTEGACFMLREGT